MKRHAKPTEAEKIDLSKDLAELIPPMTESEAAKARKALEGLVDLSKDLPDPGRRLTESEAAEARKRMEDFLGRQRTRLEENLEGEEHLEGADLIERAMNDEGWDALIADAEKKLNWTNLSKNKKAELKQQRYQLILHSEALRKQMRKLEHQMATLMSLQDEALNLNDKKKAEAYKVRIGELDKERDKLKEKLEPIITLLNEMG